MCNIQNPINVHIPTHVHADLPTSHGTPSQPTQSNHKKKTSHKSQQITSLLLAPTHSLTRSKCIKKGHPIPPSLTALTHQSYSYK